MSDEIGVRPSDDRECPTCGRSSVADGRCVSCGWHSQEAADRAFEAALDARDHAALANEIMRRLDQCTYGTSVSFKCGDGHPVAWRGTVDRRTHHAMAETAATALIGYADEIGLVIR